MPERHPHSSLSTRFVDRDEVSKGTVYGLTAYVMWGAFPLYFWALKPAGAWEILSHRIIWTFVFCGAILLVQRDLGWARQLWRRPRLGVGVTLAGFFIATNWVVYVYAVITGRTAEASLGYFLNPIVTVGLGIVILRERLRPLQWVAVVIGLGAAIYLSIVTGSVPAIAITLAVSFGLYGLVKKKVGASLEAMQSLTAETALLVPVAMGLILWLGSRAETTFTTEGPTHTTLLLSAGIITAIPLLFFAAAARRIPLVTVGLLQFITPVLQLLVAVTLLGEHVSPQRWVGFVIVWVALVVLSADAVRQRHRAHSAPAGSASSTPSSLPANP